MSSRWAQARTPEAQVGRGRVTDGCGAGWCLMGAVVGWGWEGTSTEDTRWGGDGRQTCAHAGVGLAGWGWGQL